MSITPVTYLDAIDDIELYVSENKLCDDSFEESLQRIIDELDLPEFDADKDGDYALWDARRYQDKQDLIRAHRETWFETKFTIHRRVKLVETDWIGSVVDDNGAHRDTPIVVKFRDIEHFFYYPKDGVNYVGGITHTLVLDSGLPK
jgi:hypothetical protein